jgi:hypothetical protein
MHENKYGVGIRHLYQEPKMRLGGKSKLKSRTSCLCSSCCFENIRVRALWQL